MAEENRILFVEGADDEHTLYALCTHFNVPHTFVIEVPDSKGKINKSARSTHKGGIDNVFKALQGYLFASNIERLGIVVDADENLNVRWQKVRNILEKAGYTNLSYKPDPNGTVIKQEEKITVGVWIMPDNQIERGYLETFLTFLVPDSENNQAWHHAKASVDQLSEKPFVKEIADYTTKAEIHTFLAWQEDPGTPFGLSITKKFLQAESTESQSFVSWLNRLFFED